MWVASREAPAWEKTLRGWLFHKTYSVITSDFRDVFFQMNICVLQVVSVDVDLDELEEAEAVLPNEAGEAAGEGPRQQDVGRLAHRLVDLLVREVEVLREPDAAEDELAHLAVNLWHHRGEGELLGKGGLLEGGARVGERVRNVRVFHFCVNLKRYLFLIILETPIYERYFTV